MISFTTISAGGPKVTTIIAAPSKSSLSFSKVRSPVSRMNASDFLFLGGWIIGISITRALKRRQSPLPFYAISL